MSLDTPAAASPPTDDEDGGLLRLEGIETTEEVLPEPARHGANLQFLLEDQYRPEREVPYDVGDRALPDGSLYQHTRARVLEAIDEDDLVTVDRGNRELDYVVLDDNYQLEGEDETVAVSLNSSRCELGTTTAGGDFRAWFSYNVTLQPLDEDGEIAWSRTPTSSLNIQIRPQSEELVKRGQDDTLLENWSPPFGDGTQVIAQTTWAENPDEIQDRVVHLLEETLAYDVDDLDVNHDSRRFWKAEVHHRISDDVADEIAYTLRQSTDLLARHEADVEEKTIHEDGTWNLLKIATAGWEQLGFPILAGQTIEVKVYMPDAPAEYLEYPYDQPKLEVSLRGRPRGGHAYRAERWDQIVGVLEEVLLSHLKWADVGAGHILEDDKSEGPNADLRRWNHPAGRRAWLADHYESLENTVIYEARKPQTRAVYDILHSLRRREVATYDELAQDTGLHKRTVRGHVARLCGDEERPGVLKRIRDACTFVAFSATFWEDDAHGALDSVLPDDTAEDRARRARVRRETRLLERVLGDDGGDTERTDDAIDEDHGENLEADADPESADRDDDVADESAPESWSPFAELAMDAKTLGFALEDGAIDEDHVRVRTDPYPTLTD